MSEGSQGSVRIARAGLASVALALLVSAAGCIGPGLEPPWGDDEPGGTSRASTSASPGLEAPDSPASMDDGAEGDFGNSTSGGAAGSAATGGTGAQPTVPTTAPPSSAAGSGAIEPPPAMTPPDPMGGANDPVMMAGASGASGLFGVDFVPECDTEEASELQSVEACRYPLSDALLPELAALQVATLDAGEAMVLVRGDSALSCLFGSDYYVDVASVPAAIVLCSQLCDARSPSAQLVAIEGCPPPP